MFIKYENGIYNLEKVESIYTENLKIILYYVDGKGIESWLDINFISSSERDRLFNEIQDKLLRKDCLIKVD